jgi:hypothetical protein
MTGVPEAGGDRVGRKLRWYALRVAPPLIAVAGIIDMILIRPEGAVLWRFLACLGLIGVVPFERVFNLLGKG